MIGFDFLITIAVCIGMPLVIGYIYALKSPHRPEYDAVGRWDGIGK